MHKPERDEQETSKETEQRLRKILSGAFSGPPTPLKDIPKKDGEPRSNRDPKKQK